MTKRILAPNLPRNIILTSPPKAGTHLLKAIVEDITMRKSTPLRKSDSIAMDCVQRVIEDLHYRQFIFHGHFRLAQFPSRFRRHWQVIVLIRDPRDILLAIRDDIISNSSEQGRLLFDYIQALSPEDQLLVLMDGIVSDRHELGSIERHCRGFIEWKERGAIIVRYEDLIDGANFDFGELASVLQVDVERVKRALKNNVGRNTRTLNIGVKERWKSEMSEPVCRKFMKNTGKIVERLGYSWE